VVLRDVPLSRGVVHVGHAEALREPFRRIRLPLGGLPHDGFACGFGRRLPSHNTSPVLHIATHHISINHTDSLLHVRKRTELIAEKDEREEPASSGGRNDLSVTLSSVMTLRCRCNGWCIRIVARRSCRNAFRITNR
jgi:hypothetical protein